MELSPVEIRILGCLIEKEAATPDNYPLSTNALVNACNQTTNRDPVVHYDERAVDAAMLELRAGKGLARTITGGRANKHRHVLDEAWGLDQPQLAVLAVLMLRGPQTPGELRSRTDRLHAFEDLDDVERILDGLAARDEPMVRQLARGPGQKESRWEHLLGGAPANDGEEEAPPPFESERHPRPGAPTPTAPADDSRIDTLEAEVARLRSDVDRLYELLGEAPE